MYSLTHSLSFPQAKDRFCSLLSDQVQQLQQQLESKGTDGTDSGYTSQSQVTTELSLTAIQLFILPSTYTFCSPTRLFFLKPFPVSIIAGIVALKELVNVIKDPRIPCSIAAGVLALVGGKSSTLVTY